MQSHLKSPHTCISNVECDVVFIRIYFKRITEMQKKKTECVTRNRETRNKHKIRSVTNIYRTSTRQLLENGCSDSPFSFNRKKTQENKYVFIHVIFINVDFFS